MVFASGVGTIADRAQVSAGALLVDADPHPLAIASDHGTVNVEALIEEVQPPGEPMRVAVSTPPHPRADDGRLADLRIAVGADSRRIWKTLADLASVPTFPVRGRVTGTTDRALVFGRDEQGSPQVRAHASDGGDLRARGAGHGHAVVRRDRPGSLEHDRDARPGVAARADPRRIAWR